MSTGAGPVGAGAHRQRVPLPRVPHPSVPGHPPIRHGSSPRPGTSFHPPGRPQCLPRVLPLWLRVSPCLSWAPSSAPASPRLSCSPPPARPGFPVHPGIPLRPPQVLPLPTPGPPPHPGISPCLPRVSPTHPGFFSSAHPGPASVLAPLPQPGSLFPPSVTASLRSLAPCPSRPPFPAPPGSLSAPNP